VLPSSFDVERPPISLPRLEERLKMLHEQDARVIDQIRSFILWDRQPAERTDQDVKATYQRLMSTVPNRFVRSMIQARMDMRTIISAIRRRRVGLGPPSGVGQWVEHIRRHYSHPQFHLQNVHPWIAPFELCLEEGDALEAQRTLFSFSYHRWSRIAEQYTFSFEAVVLYLARWEIIDRWTSRNYEAGQARFHRILSETLGEYSHLFA
jgi:hypothetical protein